MGAFNSYNTLMGTAQLECGLAMFILPPAVMINFQFKSSQGNPVNLELASKAWDDAVKGIEKSATELQQSVSSITATDWTADDRAAYEKKVQEFIAQLEVLGTFVQAVGIALEVYAWAMMVYAIFAIAMGTFLAVLAAVAAAALAGIITAPIAATCQTIAATCLTITIVATGIQAFMAQLAAMVFQGGALLAAAGSAAHGNDQAMADYKQAQAVGAAAAAANLAQNAVNAGLNLAGARAPIGGSSSPLKAVDLDADRNANQTWNVGGGATFSAGGIDHTVGGHVKYGDQGFAGGDLSYKGKHSASGVTAGGNVEYTDEDGIGQGKDGSVKYGANAGVETPGSYKTNPSNPGQGYSVPLPTGGISGGISGSHDFETGKGKVEGNVGGTVNGGDVGRATGSHQYDGQGNSYNSGKVDTPFGTFDDQDDKPPWEK
ncbi:hypothetical protein [Actinomadura sp. 6N118]|uniref:hypothetical protein n=1 Tax=Actinomadura sp. 6N118 TaxID=3375151 RepID=UPI0037A583E4